MSQEHVREQTAINRLHWDEVSATASDHPYYLVSDVLAGQPSLSSTERSELGDIRGLRGLHLQAGIGLDTITLARMGAEMTGVDISAEACDAARRLSAECEVDIPFVQADVLDLKSLPARSFDFIYTSHGVLRWLPSLSQWAANVHALLRPLGWFYMYEIHPLLYRLESTEAGAFILSGNYFDEMPRAKTVAGTHLGTAEALAHREVVHADWTVGSVLQSLLDADLRLLTFAEHGASSYSRKGLLPVRRDGLWRPAGPSPMPIAFSLKAMRTHSATHDASQSRKATW